jgi:hypothetical protein
VDELSSNGTGCGCSRGVTHFSESKGASLGPAMQQVSMDHINRIGIPGG